MNDPEFLRGALLVADTLDALGVPYAIGGSLASVLHGFPRTTIDADLVADLQPEHISPFVRALRDEFHVNPLVIVDAMQRRSSFNLVHKTALFKVDVFLPKHRPFDQMQLERRGREVILDEPERTAWVTSAEDIILVKLEWFRMGGEVSERQWRDVLGVIKTQGSLLDEAYLRQWAAELAVSDLLERAFKEVVDETGKDF